MGPPSRCSVVLESPRTCSRPCLRTAPLDGFQLPGGNAIAGFGRALLGTHVLPMRRWPGPQSVRASCLLTRCASIMTRRLLHPFDPCLLEPEEVDEHCRDLDVVSAMCTGGNVQSSNISGRFAPVAQITSHGHRPSRSGNLRDCVRFRVLGLRWGCIDLIRNKA
jgi:hypothetical protein